MFHPPREKAPLKPCPIAGCDEPVQRGKLMCLSHWKGVPHKIRAEVNETWRDFRRCEKGAAQLFAIRRYRAASDAAISSVGGPAPEVAP